MTADLINEKILRQALEPIGFDCCYLRETESTNTDALQYFHLHQRPVVAVSETQTSGRGRGRRGRQWLSPFARNIYCTIGITKTLAASNQGMLSLVTGVLAGADTTPAVAQAAATDTDEDAQDEQDEMEILIIQALDQKTDLVVQDTAADQAQLFHRWRPH